MITISEARARILQQGWTKASTYCPLLESVGRVLADDVVSDIDSPPHDKSLVDGFALRSADVVAVGIELEAIARLTAGELPRTVVRAGTAIQIMTGAPLPPGADAVVMVEQTSGGTATGDAVFQPGPIRIDAPRVTEGQNIMRRGAAMVHGAVVLPAGHVVRSVDVGLLAEVGCTLVPVIAPPRVAVLATGNELVDAANVPAAGMIRNSNGPLLCALAGTLTTEISDLGIAADQPDLLQQAIEQGLQHDVLVLSGGVSAGVLDLVPRMLEQAGVEPVFHKVQLRPGKPMWFGVKRGSDHRCLVFGLPGNPVGSLVCFELFVAPVLRRLGGQTTLTADPLVAHLAVPHHHQSDRPTYHPARVERLEGGQLAVTPVAWQGSADQRALALANGLVLFPPPARQFAMGESVEVVMLPHSQSGGL